MFFLPNVTTPTCFFSKFHKNEKSLQPTVQCTVYSCIYCSQCSCSRSVRVLLAQCLKLKSSTLCSFGLCRVQLSAVFVCVECNSLQFSSVQSATLCRIGLCRVQLSAVLVCAECNSLQFSSVQNPTNSLQCLLVKNPTNSSLNCQWEFLTWQILP